MVSLVVLAAGISTKSQINVFKGIKMNTLEEINAELKYIGKTIEDIAYGYVFKEGSYNPEEEEYAKEVIFDSRVNTKFYSIEYDDGFGGQQLFGIIVFKDNSWLEREEYDGAENWQHKNTPQLDEVFPRSQEQKDYKEGVAHLHWLVKNKISTPTLIAECRSKCDR